MISSFWCYFMCHLHETNNKSPGFLSYLIISVSIQITSMDFNCQTWNMFIFHNFRGFIMVLYFHKYKYRLLKSTRETRYKMKTQNTFYLPVYTISNILSLGLRENVQVISVYPTVILFLYYTSEYRNSICLHFSSCNSSEELLHSPPYGSDDSSRNVAGSSILNSSSHLGFIFKTLYILLQ